MDSRYLANMEDVLDLYGQEAVEGRARVCFDERPCQLLGEVVAPLPMKEGKLEKQDNEYKRNGTAVVLLAYDIDTGQRYVQVRRRRTKEDYAQFMEWLAREHYGHAGHIELVQDNLNTHSHGSFYENLPAADARELARKFNFHFTPKHGSWLNMAEIEFSVLARECLNRRIGSIEELEREVLIWCEKRNRKAAKIHWSFTVNTARVKLAEQYQKVNIDNYVSNN
ncbi:IS630 family transposase [Pontibacter sp. E15-1]|nr:IS630 family transposase [Pontibacter sp. E15-1]